MKIRTEAVLRFHKFKKDKQPHEYQFSELQLYYPHTNNPKDGHVYSLELEKDDPDICQETYLSSDIHIVKSKIMPFLVAVEEGIEAAHELHNTVGNDLDPQNEQDRLECQDIGLEDNPDFLARDSTEFLESNEASPEKGLFKTTVVKPDNEIFPLIRRMDQDQRLVVDIAMTYIKNIIISRKIPYKFSPPKIIIQGGAGAGKSSVIHCCSIS